MQRHDLVAPPPSHPERSRTERAAMRAREEERLGELREANPDHPLIRPPETD